MERFWGCHDEITEASDTRDALSPRNDMSHRAAIVAGESAGDRMQIAEDSLASLTMRAIQRSSRSREPSSSWRGQSGKVLDLTSTIVECIEDDSVRSVLPTVQALGSAGISFVESRLEATHGILEAAGAEMKVLQRLSKVSQKPVRNRSQDPGIGDDDKY